MIRAKHDQNVQQLDRMRRRYEDSHRDAIQAKLNLEKVEFNPKVCDCFCVHGSVLTTGLGSVNW